ncbi:two-component system, NarL family, sensor histidine kinase DesK [Pedococcus cremeus]|uniref:Two-component system, NarL family, sensor histidine kinase DesK n=1 Tax=Pedococcus cremeus TaxID=587636 RepID=A0A1H9V218_9MICO|nr:two-component system, NarL family, sensor histidine kinase DesK [Pedococcus cremeus]
MAVVNSSVAVPRFLRGDRTRYWGLFFAGVWLVFLVPVVVSAARRGTVRDWLGIAVLVAFSVAYLLAITVMRRFFRARTPGSQRFGATMLVVLVALSVCAVLLLGADALSTAPYLAVTGVVVFRRWGPLWVIALAAVVEGLARLTTGWQHLDGIGYSVLGAGFIMWGVILMMQRNLELVRTHEAEAELAVETERVRFARDLHDILGHSLTVITVKAELAGRLIEVDPARARAEVAELERLARDALADVRRTVVGYREITLPGELARARAALQTAGITASVSSSAEAPPSHLRELFAWVVREGVTNVVRHSRATECSVTVAPLSVTVRDNGVGPGTDTVSGGNGLRGIRERAAAVGARVVAGAAGPRGFSLQVSATGAEPGEVRP